MILFHKQSLFRSDLSFGGGERAIISISINSGKNILINDNDDDDDDNDNDDEEDDMEGEEVLWKCGLLRSNLVSTVVGGSPTKVLKGQGGRKRSVLLISFPQIVFAWISLFQITIFNA